MAVKVCFIDVTHWHAPPYYKTLQQLVGVAALRIVDAAYRSAAQGSVVQLS